MRKHSIFLVVLALLGAILLLARPTSVRAEDPPASPAASTSVAPADVPADDAPASPAPDSSATPADDASPDASPSPDASSSPEVAPTKAPKKAKADKAPAKKATPVAKDLTTDDVYRSMGMPNLSVMHINEANAGLMAKSLREKLGTAGIAEGDLFSMNNFDLLSYLKSHKTSVKDVVAMRRYDRTVKVWLGILSRCHQLVDGGKAEEANKLANFWSAAGKTATDAGVPLTQHDAFMANLKADTDLQALWAATSPAPSKPVAKTSKPAKADKGSKPAPAVSSTPDAPASPSGSSPSPADDAPPPPGSDAPEE